MLDEAQGEGLGRALWQRMRTEHASLFWRSRHGNPVNALYDAECDGCIKTADWRIYWYGIDSFDAVDCCVRHCLARQPSLFEVEQ